MSFHQGVDGRIVEGRCRSTPQSPGRVHRTPAGFDGALLQELTPLSGLDHRQIGERRWRYRPH